MNHIIGILWFNNHAAYDRARELFNDSKSMPATFEDWKALVKRELEEIRHAGNIALRVEFNAKKFMAWCNSRGLQPNSEARTSFTEHIVLEYQKTGEGTVIE